MKKMLAAFLASGLICFSASAKSILPGNLLISSVDQIYEYTTDGSYVQKFSTYYPGESSATEHVRDVAADVNGKIFIYNGTFEPYMSIYDSQFDSWNHLTYAGFSTVNNASYGGIDVYGNTVFTTDMSTYSGGEGQGIVAFDTSTGTALRFAEDIDPIDLTIGLNGLLYALSPGGTPGGRTISIYDPVTFEYINSIDLTIIFGWTEHRSLAVDSNGDIFIADWDGEILHVNSDGTYVDKINPPCRWIGYDIKCEFTDIDIAEDGTIALATRFGEIILTDTSFSHTSKFEVGVDNTFVEFVHTKPIPPTPPLSVSFETACSDLSCSFTDTSTDNEGVVSAWSWDFGDGQTSAEQHPNHVYSAVGSYNVSLTATNDVGNSAFTSQVVNVTGRLHVADIVLEKRDGGQGDKYVRAWVTVVDNYGSPVNGATVTGTFTGVVNKMSQAVTGSDGTALLEAGPTRGRTHFSFCVNNAVSAMYTYDSADNLETCDNFK